MYVHLIPPPLFFFLDICSLFHHFHAPHFHSRLYHRTLPHHYSPLPTLYSISCTLRSFNKSSYFLEVHRLQRHAACCRQYRARFFTFSPFSSSLRRILVSSRLSLVYKYPRIWPLPISFPVAYYRGQQCPILSLPFLLNLQALCLLIDRGNRCPLLPSNPLHYALLEERGPVLETST